MERFEFPAILSSGCFPSRSAALRYWLRHQWRGVRMRLDDEPAWIDSLPLMMIALAALVA